MRHIAVFAAALLVATMTGGADAEPRSHLTVRVYNSMGLPAADIMQASAIAEPILRDAGMDVRFRQCGISVQPDGSLDRCNCTQDRDTLARSQARLWLPVALSAAKNAARRCGLVFALIARPS